MVFGSIITNLHIKKVTNFSVKIPFEEAITDVLPIKGTSKEGMCKKKTKFKMGPLYKVQLWDKAEFQQLWDKAEFQCLAEEETRESHTNSMGPVKTRLKVLPNTSN